MKLANFLILFSLFADLTTPFPGALHALEGNGGRLAKRVAVVDFDVHHGNGTEACVRNVTPTQVREQWECAGGVVSMASTSFKPWLTSADGDLAKAKKSKKASKETGVTVDLA